MSLDPAEGLEAAGDVAFRLLGAPAVPSGAVDRIEAVGGRLLDADGGHAGSGPVAGDDLGGGERPVGGVRRGEGMGELGPEPLESLPLGAFPLGAFPVAPDQVADVFADVLAGPVLANIGTTKSLSVPLIRTINVVVRTRPPSASLS